jgi:hypothetical protein
MRLVLSVTAASACNLDFNDDTPPSGGTGVLDDDDDDADADCCEAHDSPDCENPILSTCVCDARPQCCEDSWDPSCVDAVEDLGCGVCGEPESCCDVGDEPGCDVPAVETCVCEFDPVCCEQGWDEQCVADVFLFGCGICPGATSCCVADGAPGCMETDVQACVCEEEPSCCAEAWDFQCVQQVEALGCGMCMSPGEASGG